MRIFAHRSHFIVLVLGGFIGATLWNLISKPASIQFAGQIHSDSASHKDSYLSSSSLYLPSQVAPRGRIFLRFSGNEDRSQGYAAIGKEVSLLGELRSVTLDDNTTIAELRVTEIRMGMPPPDVER